MPQPDAQVMAMATYSSDWVCWFDRTLRHAYVNPAGATVFGMASEQIVGQRLGELPVDGLFAAVWEQHLQAAFDHPTEVRPDFECTGPYGTDFYLVRLVPLPGNDVSTDLVIAIVRDITRFKETEARLRAELEAAAHLTQVVKILEQPCDLDASINDILDLLLDVFGADRAWLIHPCDPTSKTFTVPFERTRPAYPGMGGSDVELPLEGGTRHIMEAVISSEGPVVYGPDTPFPADLEPLRQALSLQAQMLTAIHPRIGKPWVLGIHQCEVPRRWSPLEQRLFQDISERLREGLSNKLLHAEVDLSLSLLRATLEASADGVLVIGTDGSIRTYNQRFLDMWGLSEAHMRAPRSTVPCMTDQLVDPDAFMARVRELYAEPEAESCDLLELKDGRIFERISRPQRLGEVAVGRLWSYRDISAIRRAEIELARHARELEATTHELQETDRYKDEFLAVISHELRTPLNCITGFGSLLDHELAGTLDQAQQDYLKRILGGADRMLGLINNLLDVGRMRAGKFQVDPYETDYPPIIEEIVSTLEPLARDKGLTVKQDVTIDRLVTLDPARISQVLMNLLDNAIKFVSEGGHIRLGAWIEGDRLVTEVRDDGPGIAEADLPRVFQPFKQLDMGSTRKVQGAGLGLAICKNIVAAHGGTLEVRSRLGAGSTFRFELPLTP